MPVEPRRHDTRQSMLSADFELQYKRDTDLAGVELHHHDFYEIYYLISGDVTYTIDGRLCRVTPGDLLLVGPRELHKLQIRGAEQGYERYVLWVQPSLLSALGEPGAQLDRALDSSRPEYRNLLHLGEENRRVRGIIEALNRECNRQDYGGELMKRCLLTELLLMINRVSTREGAAEELPETNRVVTQVIDYVADHYGESITLDLLAETFYISKYHLSHEFHRQTGTSVYRYIQKKRLMISRELLAEGRKPSEVAPLCGFGDYTLFYRAFKGEYGCSPRDFVRESQPAERRSEYVQTS